MGNPHWSHRRATGFHCKSGWSPKSEEPFSTSKRPKSSCIYPAFQRPLSSESSQKMLRSFMHFDFLKRGFRSLLAKEEEATDNHSHCCTEEPLGPQKGAECTEQLACPQRPRPATCLHCLPMKWGTIPHPGIPHIPSEPIPLAVGDSHTPSTSHACVA